MAEVGAPTLIGAIQAVALAIKYQEKMLDAEALGDRSDTMEYLLVLEKTRESLRYAYLEERRRNKALPEYESLLKIRL